MKKEDIFLKFIFEVVDVEMGLGETVHFPAELTKAEFTEYSLKYLKSLICCPNTERYELESIASTLVSFSQFYDTRNK